MQQIFYGFIKIWVRLSLKVFCKQVVVHNPEQLAAKGPLIIAAHHPNSFFDAILIGAFMQQPVQVTVSGRAVDAYTGQAIPGAVVEVTSRRATSDEM